MRKGKLFEKQIQELMQEIELSSQWGQAIILFALYRSRHTIKDAEDLLETRINTLGKKLHAIQISPITSNVLPTIRAVDTQKHIFTITDISNGSGDDQADAYRFLNLYREYFLEENLRCIFWLTEEEMQELALHAPDFWAFRHRVVDFYKIRATPKSATNFQGLDWLEWEWGGDESDYQAAIIYREEILGSLLEEGEGASFLATNLYAEIAGLNLQDEQNDLALEAIQKAIALLPKGVDAHFAVKLYRGKALILIQKKEYEAAYKTLQENAVDNAENSTTSYILAKSSRLGGRRTQGLKHIKKALSLNPEEAAYWNEAGNIYSDLGRVDAALDSYQKAIELNPGNYYPLLNQTALLNSTRQKAKVAQNLVALKQYHFKDDLADIAALPGFDFLKEI